METVNNLEQEIAQLQQRIEKLKETKPAEQMPTQQELAHEVVGERIQQAVPEYQPEPAAPTQDTPSYELPEVKDAIGQLHALAENNIYDAFDKMKAAKNPALIAAFHAYLVDMLLGKLVAAKKIEAVE